MPTPRIGSRSKNKSPTPGQSGRSSTLSGGSPTRTQSLVARIFSNPLRKSNNNRSSASTPRDGSPAGQSQSPARSPKDRRSPTTSQSPARPPTGSTGRSPAGQSHSPSPNRSPVRSPSRRPGRGLPPGLPPQDPLPLYPPGRGGRRRSSSTGTPEHSGAMQAQSREVSTFDSRGVPKGGGTSTPLTPDASGGSAMNEDTISVPLKPARTPKNSDTPPPLDLFPSNTAVSSAGAVADTSDVVHRTGPFGPGKGYLRHPTHTTNDIRTVSTAADPASVADTFNEEVDERSIIPVADSVTLQQLSGALDPPIPGPPTLNPHSHNRFVPPPSPAPFVPPPDCSAPKAGGCASAGISNALTTSDAIPTSPTAMDHSGGLKQRDSGEEESSNEFSWGLQKLSERARGGGPGTHGGSPSFSSSTPRPPSPGANTSSLRLQGGSSASSNRGMSPDRDSTTDNYNPPHPAAAAAAAAAVAAAAAGVDNSVDDPPVYDDYYPAPQKPVGLPGSPPASAPPAPQLKDDEEEDDALMHDDGGPSDSDYTSTLLPPPVAATATHVGAKQVDVGPGTARAAQSNPSFGRDPDQTPVQVQSGRIPSAAAGGGGGGGGGSNSGYTGAGSAGGSGPVRRAEPAGPSMTPLKRGLVSAEEDEADEACTEDQEVLREDEEMPDYAIDSEESPLEAVPYASLDRRAPRPMPPPQDTSYRQIPSGPSGRFSIHEMAEGGLTDMHATSSPPIAPHTTVAQRAALGQLVPNSISSEMSDRRAQAFSDLRDSMHPDGDDAMAHALEPVTATPGSQNPSIDFGAAPDPAASVPVATADNGTPVDTATATIQEAAAQPPDTISPDNPYVVIQKSGAPSQPSSARLFYQPPTSLNANAPGSISSQAGAQAGAAAGAAMMASQSASPTPADPGPVPQNIVVSSPAAEIDTTATSSGTPERSARSSSRPYSSKTRANPSSHSSRFNPAASDPPSAVSMPAGAGGNTRSPTASAPARSTVSAVPSDARTVPRTRQTHLSASPPAPGTPPTSYQKPRMSYGSSLYSQSFSPMSRSHSTASVRSSAGPAPLAAPSVTFTYRKAYNYYPTMYRSPGGAYGAYVSRQAPADAQYRGYGSPRPQSMGPGALPPPGSQQAGSGGARTASVYGAHGPVVPPPVSGSSVRSMYSSYSAAPPVSTPNAAPAPSSPYTARYSTGAAPSSAAYSTRAYASAYASTAAVAASQLSSTSSTLPPEEYRPAFGAAARMRGLEHNFERPGSRETSPVRSNVLTMRERMHSTATPSAAAPSPVQLEPRQRINAHSGALPRAAQPASAHVHAHTNASSVSSAVHAALPAQHGMKSPRTQRADKPAPAPLEPASVAAAPPTPAEASTKVASAAAAAVSPEASGRLDSPAMLQSSGRLKAALHPEAAAAVQAAFDVQVPLAEPLALRAGALPASESPSTSADLRVRTKGAMPAPAAPASTAVAVPAAVAANPAASIRRSGSSLRVPAAALLNADAAAEAADAAAAANVAAATAAAAVAAAAAAAAAAPPEAPEVPEPVAEVAIPEEPEIDDPQDSGRVYKGPLPPQGIQLLQPQARMRSPFAVEPPKDGGELSLVLMGVHGTWLMGASDRSAPLLITQRSSLTTAAGSGNVA